ncbi:hypothetical protein CEW89_06570 [Celeribacter ethanolicus]|uniref:Type VII secretion system protein EssD-like domain-containing protein n=1 Tax=Celeribacter ethanolicus TaxID=1758178 RepID=A0A291GB40_9RHOB|nr:DNA/RNA non-specific endonuclease [Celeribacter ethanolicus]ATG47262.1 hypothetical protein CEW89_06570 [Celeribacter ethanolicus]
MPYATKRKEPALNKSYAKLVSKHFSEAAVSLRDKLVDMGFEEGEAEDNIEAEQPGLDDGLFGRQTRPRPTMTVELDASEAERKEIGGVAPGKITVSAGDDGKTRIEFTGVPKPKDEERLFKMAPERLHGVLREKLDAFKAQHVDDLAPAHLGEEFTVPRLMAYVQGELVFGDTDILMEYHDWSLADHPARLTKAEFDIVETTNTFEIDLDGNHLSISAADSSEQLSLDIDVDDWTPNSLVRWLDGKVRDQWIGQAELLAWLSDVVTRHQRGTNEEIIQYDETTGRPMNSEGTIRQDFGSTRRGDGATGVGKLGKDGDQGGHLGAHRFFGDTPDQGIAPQAGNLNMGAWRTMENEWADWTKMGYEVDFKIDVYPPGAVRPDEFRTQYLVKDPQTGKTVYRGRQRFENEPGQSFKRITWREMQQNYAR